MIIKNSVFGHRLHYLVIILVTLAGFTGACTGTETPPGDSIEDTKWILESCGEPENLQPVIAGTTITATFDSNKSEVTGNAGCNHYSAEYQIDNYQLHISQICYTEMYCMEPEGVMDQEADYLTLLSSAESFRIEDGKLNIVTGDKVLVYHME